MNLGKAYLLLSSWALLMLTALGVAVNAGIFDPALSASTRHHSIEADIQANVEFISTVVLAHKYAQHKRVHPGPAVNDRVTQEKSKTDKGLSHRHGSSLTQNTLNIQKKTHQWVRCLPAIALCFVLDHYFP